MRSEIDNAIEIQNLSVAYSAVVGKKVSQNAGGFRRSTKLQKINALSDVSVNFPAGKVTGLIGGNGAGKSSADSGGTAAKADSTKKSDTKPSGSSKSESSKAS